MSSSVFPKLAPSLEGDLVQLEQLDERFLEPAFSAVNDSEVRRLTGTKKTFTREEIAAWLQTRPSAANRLDWAILHDGDYVGEVVLNEFDELKNAMNLRIALAGPQFFSRGFGSEAVALAVDFGFDQLKLAKITLSVLVDNPRAMGTYEKVGFVTGREYSEGKLRYLRMSITLIDRLQALAERKMAEHLDLREWAFTWDNAKRRAGLCNYTERKISISKYHASVHGIDETMQVVLHEIAHAMCGKKAGHSKTWLEQAKAIGYRAEKFTGREIAQEHASWVGVCPNGHEHFRYRKPTRELSCALCSRGFSRANLIEWRSK